MEAGRAIADLRLVAADALGARRSVVEGANAAPRVRLAFRATPHSILIQEDPAARLRRVRLLNRILQPAADLR